MPQPSFSTENYTPDRLHAGDFPIRSISVVLIAGQNLTRGAVVGKITASKKVNLSLSAAVDGSESVYAILAEDTDATAADKNATAYVSGDFNEDSLTIGTGHTADSIRDALRAIGLHIRKPFSA